MPVPEHSREEHVLVVGASSGIGFSVAKTLSLRMSVSAIARRTENLDLLPKENIHTAYCDVQELASIEPLAKELVEKFGKFTAIIYCAGKQSIKPVRMSKAANVQEVFDINLLAPFEFARLFARSQYSTDKAVFCAITSIAASRPEPGIVAYSAAKAGLEAMIKGLAREVAPRRVVGIAPGWLDTEMTQSYSKIYNEDFKETLSKSSPLGIADVESVVDAVDFLCSDAGKFVTGQILTVDGGASL